MKAKRSGVFAAIAVVMALTLSACGSDKEEKVEVKSESVSISVSRIKSKSRCGSESISVSRSESTSRSSSISRRGYTTAHFAGKKNKHRSHLLAFAFDDVVRYFIEQHIFAFHGGFEVIFKFVHFGGDGSLNFIEHSCGGRVKLRVKK